VSSSITQILLSLVVAVERKFQVQPAR